MNYLEAKEAINQIVYAILETKDRLILGVIVPTAANIETIQQRLNKAVHDEGLLTQNYQNKLVIFLNDAKTVVAVVHIRDLNRIDELTRYRPKTIHAITYHLKGPK